MKKSDQSRVAVGIIPARYHATRFPGKLLARLGGKSVLEHVYRRAETARKLDGVLVATDDERIEQAVLSFGGRVEITSARPQSGMERVAEASRKLSAGVVVNIQGDEPFIRGEMIDRVVEELYRDPQLVMVTLAKAIEDFSEMANPNVVKVVINQSGFALYFSRSSIPFSSSGVSAKAYKHIGLYGYRKDFLSALVELPPGDLEISEGLEQLRVLENGYKIKVLKTRWDTIAIDTPQDLENAGKLLEGSDK